MNNYMHTTMPGTKRRRAKQIVISYPAQPLTPPEPVLTYDPLNPDAEPVLRAPDLPVPSITFVMEDRVIMADGSEMFVAVGNLIVNLDTETLSKQYPHVDIKTGNIDNSRTRYGLEIMQMVVAAFEDVFVYEGMARDQIQTAQQG